MASSAWRVCSCGIFRELIRGIDSSLLEEWERLRNPAFVVADAAEKPDRPAAYDLTRDVPAFRRQVRAAIFGFLQDVLVRDWESAAEKTDGGGRTTDGGGQTAESGSHPPVAGGADPGGPGAPAEAMVANAAKALEAAFAPYFEARGRFRLDPAGRAAGHTHWVEESRVTGEWTVAQVLVDPEEVNDWEIEFTVDLAASRAENRAVLRGAGVRPVGTM